MLRTAAVLLRSESVSLIHQLGAASSCSVSRCISSTNTPDKEESSSVAPPPASSQVQQSAAQEADASSSARINVDKLRQASPTGKLLDLFAAPSSSGGDRGASPASPDAKSSAAAAAVEALQQLQARDVVQIILQAVENCKPLMKVTSVKAGTKLLYIPKVSCHVFDLQYPA
jgi:hypothetical protein